MATTESARPLSGEVRDKLEVSLRPEAPRGPEKKWREWAPRLSVAAAVIIALAIFVPALTHGPGPAASHSAAGPLDSFRPVDQGGHSRRPCQAGPWWSDGQPLYCPGQQHDPSRQRRWQRQRPGGNAPAANSNGPTRNSNGPTPTIPSARLGPPTTSGRPTVLGPATNRTSGRRKRRLPPPPRRSTASARPRGQRRVANGSRSGGQT